MKFLRLLSYGVILLVFFALGARLMVKKIEIGQVGVLTKEWGEGLVHEDFGPGFWWSIDQIHSWSIFDSTVQSLHMTAKEGEGPLDVKSLDGANVKLDVTIKYRIKPGSAWNLRRDLGEGEGYKKKVRNEAVDAMRPVFGMVRTEDFYNPDKRGGMAEEAVRILTERLDRIHVELVTILIRDVSFDKSYEDQIKSKELAKQEGRLNVSKKNLAEKEGITNKIHAETEAKVTVIMEDMNKTMRELTAENEKSIAMVGADAQKYAVETRADADLHAAEKNAATDLLIKNAEAEAQALRQKALQGSGARNLVALEAAGNLHFTTLVISTLENNVLDLEKLAGRLGAKGRKEESGEGK